ncbi:hypothetical protein BC938DRAFT_471711 [Jimgerdemannia flammicorona]|uniref:Uncharacterized protein n=1 Tax=Jimgerdemannia flammicorona TaxID=994334 RepID=A0A433Q7K6_9FUNG|nr:hypothetical protein BC938DRAFT_471711 [Jimgerdemannia flammicorona]
MSKLKLINQDIQNSDSVLHIVLPTNKENVNLPDLKQGVSLYSELNCGPVAGFDATRKPVRHHE